MFDIKIYDSIKGIYRIEFSARKMNRKDPVRLGAKRFQIICLAKEEIFNPDIFSGLVAKFAKDMWEKFYKESK